MNKSIDDSIVNDMFDRLGRGSKQDKLNELMNYTDINKVRRIAERVGLNKIYPSTRLNKKYMVRDPITSHWIHFGQLPYEDYTFHNDLIRRDNFKKRNASWAYAPVYSPASLSYYLLW